MSDLLQKLQSATEGSRILDAAIYDLIDGSREPYPMPHFDTPNARAPHYTTSLDAKCPGEDIVMVSEQTTGRWCALQRGAREAVYANTEVLARRLAGIKAHESKEAEERPVKLPEIRRIAEADDGALEGDL